MPALISQHAESEKRQGEEHTSSDIFFRGILAAVGLSLTFIRLYYAVGAGRSAGRILMRRESRLSVAWFFLSLATLASVIYVVDPELIGWATLPLPSWLRWTGAGLGLPTVLLFLWVHHTLGKNWSASIVIKEDHILVTGGPYRWVRHPMYTNLFMWALTFFLLSANWFIGINWLVLSVGGASRVGEEEALLIEKFGDEYRVYMQQTGRFLPRLEGRLDQS